MLKILIPSCKSKKALDSMIAEICTNTKSEHQIITSNLQESASVNRNKCLEKVSHSEVAIMLDDDISGFYPSWEKWVLEPFFQDSQVVMVSARLVDENGRVSHTCSRCYSLRPAYIEIQPGANCILPTAAIAFKNLNIPFDEEFKGSGFEDSDWCFEYRRQYPNSKFIQSNKCLLCHHNEMKGQNKFWKHNETYFNQKWQVSSTQQTKPESLPKLQNVQ